MSSCRSSWHRTLYRPERDGTFLHLAVMHTLAGKLIRKYVYGQQPTSAGVLMASSGWIRPTTETGRRDDLEMTYAAQIRVPIEKTQAEMGPGSFSNRRSLKANSSG